MSSIVSSVSARAHHRGRSSGDLGRARTSVCITQSRSIPTTSLQPVLHDRRLANSATANCAPQSACPWTRPAHPARPARSRFNTHSAPPSARAVQSNGIFCLPDPDQRPHGKAAFARRVGQAKDSLLYGELFITATCGRSRRAATGLRTPSRRWQRLSAPRGQRRPAHHVGRPPLAGVPLESLPPANASSLFVGFYVLAITGSVEWQGADSTPQVPAPSRSRCSNCSTTTGGLNR